MKIFNKLLYLFILMPLLFSCSGKEDENELINVELSSDKNEIISDGIDKVVFNVFLNGKETTENVKIVNAETDNVVENGEFMTASPGVYKFYALYNNHKSNFINITASAGESPIEYKRHIAVFKFTGTWCTFCPTGGTQIDFWLEKPKYSTGHVLAFHGGSDKEPMLIPETDYLFTQVIKFSGGYPAASIDMRDKAETSSMTSDVKTGLDRSLNEFPAYFSVNISSKINMEKTKAEVSVSVNSSVTETYNVVLYVVENGLIYEQLILGYYDPTYRHDHVVRKLISKTVFGDSMGMIAAGTEAEKNYSIDIDSVWNTENLYVYALIIPDKTGYIHNLAYCSIIDGTMNTED